MSITKESIATKLKQGLDAEKVVRLFVLAI